MADDDQNRDVGELRRLKRGFQARIRIGASSKERGHYNLVTCGLDEPKARARCTALGRLANKLRAANVEMEDIDKLLEKAAKTSDARWKHVEHAVALLCTDGGTSDASTSPVTLAEFVKQWTTGELHKKYPDHVREKATSDDDERLFRNYVRDHVEDMLVADFTLDDADAIMASLPEHLSSSSRRHVAQLIRRTMSLAVYPARLRATNPIPKGWLPRVKAAKATAYLYPDEDARLLGCVDVPLLRRIAYALLHREGIRRGELARLTWSDVDIERGLLKLDQNKTNDPRAWTLGADVVIALRAWKAMQGGAASEKIIMQNGVPLYVEQLADDLRTDIERADITRPELFERSKTRRRIVAHALRAGFVTVALANGKSEAWVSSRTGHRSSTMINRYRRAAETHVEANLGWFAPMFAAVPELADVAMAQAFIAACEVLSARPRTRPNSGGNDSGAMGNLAESKGFEPLVPLQAHLISNQAPSATRTALRRRNWSTGRLLSSALASVFGGERGIRTLGALAGTHDFQSCTFGHSVISPRGAD